METQLIQIGNKQLKEVYDSNIANALEGAQKECKRVFYMPELLDARIGADKDSRLWQNWYSTPSIRVTGKTKQGKAVVAYVHIKNYFSNLENIRNPETIRNPQNVYGTRVMPREEFYKILDREDKKDVWIIDYNTLKNSPSGVILVENAIKHPQTIPFCGSEERAEKYLTRYLKVHGNQISIWHCDDLTDESLARRLSVGGSCFSGGFIGDASFLNFPRFVGWAPEPSDDSENRQLGPGEVQRIEKFQKTISLLEEDLDYIEQSTNNLRYNVKPKQHDKLIFNEVYDSDIAHSNIPAIIATYRKRFKEFFYMPDLLNFRVSSDKDSTIWSNWYLTPSIMITGKSKQGKPVVAYVHKNNWLFQNPEKIKNSIENRTLINGAAVMPPHEFHKILDLEDGKTVFVRDYELFKNAHSGILSLDEALKHPQTIPFCGGVEIAEKYLLKHQKIYGDEIGVWYNDIPLDNVAIARFLRIGNNQDLGGLTGAYILGNVGRFVGTNLDNFKLLSNRGTKSAEEQELEDTIKEVEEWHEVYIKKLEEKNEDSEERYNNFTGENRKKENEANDVKLEEENDADRFEGYAGGNKSKFTFTFASIVEPEVNWEVPKSIVKYLNCYVIGQEEAKKVVSVAFSNYMTRVKTKNEKVTKDNILILGPSGVGKTFMMSLLAKKANLPFVQSKLTGKSSEGYKGANLSKVFDQMRSLAPEEAPYGIIFLDEIDKLAKSGSDENGPEVRLQNEMIGWLEEDTIMGTYCSKGETEDYKLNTKNILFVTAGAFQSFGKEDGLAEIIKNRLLSKNNDTINDHKVLFKTKPEDLMLYGFRSELVGRLPTIAVFNPLTIEDRVRILTEARRSPLIKYYELFKAKGYTLELDDSTMQVIASRCPDQTGARALDSVCSDLFTEILFEPTPYITPNNTIRVTPELADRLITLH